MVAPGASPPSRFNFAQHVLARNAGRAGKPAYIDDERTLTYGELARATGRMARALAGLGVRREERVYVCMQDTVDFPVAFLGALHAGIVPVAINTLLTVDDHAYMLEHSRAQLLLVSGALLPTLEQAMARAAHEVRHVVVSRPAGALPEGAHDLAALLAQQPSEPPAAAPTLADDIAFWLYSSGSTGRPKGTVHTHGNLYWTAETLRPCRSSACARTTSCSPRPSCSSPTASATR